MELVVVTTVNPYDEFCFVVVVVSEMIHSSLVLAKLSVLCYSVCAHIYYACG